MSRFTHMMEQVRRLKNGVGVQSLLDAAYAILGNPIAMFNTEYSLLAYTQCETDDPLFNELITYGVFRKESQEFFTQEGFVEDVANSHIITYMTSKKLKYNRINGKLFNKNNTHVANLIYVACKRPLEEHDGQVFEAVCKLISREISRSDMYREYEQAHQEMIIRSLIDVTYDKDLDLGQVSILYDALESNLYIAVVDVSECSLAGGDTAYYLDLLMRHAPAYKYAVYAGCILCIISTGEDTLQVSRELSTLIGLFEQYNMYAGISGRFENLFELKRYYLEAVKSLEYVTKCQCSQRIFPYHADSIDVMKQIESLENGKGIQYFLNKGMEIFGNPLLFHDMEPKLLGYTENVEIADPIWQDLIAYGTGSDETVALFQTEGWIDIMDKTRGGALLVSDKCKYDRISWRIYNKDNIRFGCTSIVNTMKPFSEDELVLFGTFSQKFSKEVKQIELYDTIGQVYSDTVINRLLSGKMDNKVFYSEDIGNLYNSLMDNLFLVVLDTSQCQPGQINLAFFRNLFSWPGTVNRYAIFGAYYIIIISIQGASLKACIELNKISRVFKAHNIYAGISSCCDNIYDLQRYYIEAVSALTDGLKTQGRHKQWIFHSELETNP